MAQRLRWFDRRFSFSFEAAIYPSIVERLRGLMPRLHAKLSDIDPSTLTKHLGSTWSIQQNIGHLHDLESLWYGRLDDFFADAPQLRPADLENTKTHEADHDNQDIGAMIDELSISRQKFINRLDKMAPGDFERTAKHPRLDQPMRLVDLVLFVAEHDDHHLARITDLVRQL